MTDCCQVTLTPLLSSIITEFMTENVTHAPRNEIYCTNESVKYKFRNLAAVIDETAQELDKLE